MAAPGGYDAFISYSHSMDGLIAPALRTALEQLAKPWRRRRALRVFHDVSGLGATPGLWSTIAAALDQTRYFLLLASPAAAASHWVQQEVAYFRARRGAEAIFLVLTDGDCRWDSAAVDFDWSVTSAIPPQLRRSYREEPLFVDLRWARLESQLDLRNARFRQAVGDLAAPIRGMARDEIDALDLREHLRARRARRAAVGGLAGLTALATLTAAAAVVSAGRARQQERVADAGRLAALSIGYAGERTDLAALLALHSLRRAETRQGRVALGSAMTRPAAGYGPLVGAEGAGQVLAAGTELIAAGAPDGRVAVWNQSGPVIPRNLAGHADSISELALSPDERSVASVDIRGNLIVHDTATRRITGRVTGIADAEYEPDGGLVVAALAGDVSSRAADGRLRWTARGVSPASRAASDRAAVAASPDGRQVAVATADARIVLLDARTGAVAASWSTGGRDANDIAFSPDASLVVAAGDDGITRIWLVRDQALYAEFGGALAGIRRVAWSRDGASVVTGGFDARARLYDVGARRLVGELTGHAWPVGGLAFGADARTLWTGDHDGVRSWNLSTGRPDRLLERDSLPVTSASFSREATQLATQSVASLTLRRADEDFGQAVRISPGGFDVALSPDGRTAVSVGIDDAVRRYSTVDGKLLNIYRGSGPQLWGVDTSPDGQQIATVDELGTVAVREAATGHVLWTAKVLEDGHDVAYSVDGKALVAVGLKDTRVLLVDAATGRELHRWEVPQPEARPSALALSPDGRKLLIGRTDGRLNVLDASTLQPIQEILAHQNKIYAIAVSPDSSVVATGGFNGGGVSQSGFDPGLRLWDSATGQPIGQLVAHDGQVEALAFSPDGRWLASGGFDRQVLLWPAYEGWRGRACQVANRDLSGAERSLLLSSEDRDGSVC